MFKPRTGIEITKALPSEQLCPRYTLADIRLATQNFDERLVVGRGGFGKVYKGHINGENGSSTVVAIKRLDSTSKQGAREFRAELNLLSQLRHSNLVSLLGCCVDADEMIIVYDYMPRGTLYHHLHKSDTPFSWKRRLMISIGAARGLDYLHTGAGTKHGVIHHDIKTTNILLDEDWEAKISDFGLAKVCPTNQSITHISTSVNGTHGYLDPTFHSTGKLNRRTDVYAFGVVLFELLSGKQAVFPHDDWYISLAMWVEKCAKQRNLDQLVAAPISGTLCRKSLRVFVQLAYRCLHTDPEERPTMLNVVAALHQSLALQEKFDNRAQRAGLFGFTWKLPTKENSGNHNNSSSKKTKSKSDYRAVPTEDDARGDEVQVHPDNDLLRSHLHRSSLKNTKNSDVVPTEGDVSYQVPPNTMRNTKNTTMIVVRPLGWAHNKTHSSFEVGGSSSVPPKDDGVSCNEVVPDKEHMHSRQFKVFSFDELKKMTRNLRKPTLSDERRGRVYRGWIDKNTYIPSDEGVGLNISVLRFNCWGRGSLRILGELDHPNLHRILGYCLKDEDLYLVQELTGERTLFNYLRYGDPPLIGKVKIAVGVARALVFLHSKHLRVKGWIPNTNGISLDKDDNPKLFCFNVADWFHGLPLPGQQPCDVDGLGLLLMEILTGENLDGKGNIYDLNIEDIWDQITENSNLLIKDVVNPQIDELYSLTTKCIKRKYTIEETLKNLEQIYSKLTVK